MSFENVKYAANLAVIVGAAVALWTAIADLRSEIGAVRAEVGGLHSEIADLRGGMGDLLERIARVERLFEGFVNRETAN